MAIGGNKVPPSKNGGTTYPGNGGGNGGKKKGGGNRPPKKGRNQYDYLQLPTNKQLHEETTAATNLAYRPTERSIAAEKRASEGRTKDIGNWWNEYLAQVGAGQAATQGAYAAAAQQTQGLIGTASAVDSGNTAALNAQASQAAAARGQDASAANAATTSTANAAQATRNAGIAAMGARTAGIGANQYAYLGEKKRIGAGQRVSSMINQTKRTQKIEQDRTALRKERGEYAAKTLGQKEAEAREILLKNRGFNFEKESAAATAKAEAEKVNQEYLEFQAEQGNKQAQLELERFEAETAKQNANTSRKNANTNRYEAEHEAPNTTETPQQKARKAKGNAYAAAKTLFEKKEWPSWSALTTRLQREAEVSPADARWAVQKLREEVERHERWSHQGHSHR